MARGPKIWTGETAAADEKILIKELLLNIQDKDLIGVDGTVRGPSPRDKRIMPCIQGGR
jgi:hypothetical protein